MVYNSMETDYLLSVLKAVLNKDAVGDTGAKHDWGLLFNLSAYHRVQSMVGYAFLFHESMSPEWRERYGRRFRKLVSKDASYRKLVQEVVKIIEGASVPCILLPPQEAKGLYPQPELREVEGLYLLIPREEQRRFFTAMQAGGFFYEGEDIQGGYKFVSREGWRVNASTRLFSFDKKLERSFSGIWAKASPLEGGRYLFRLSPEEQYLLMMGCSAVRFSLGQADIRDAADLYLYLKAYGETLNWTYIDQRLCECDMLEFGNGLRALSCIWFARLPEEIHNEGYLDMEEYILSRGMYAKEACMKLLPVMARLEIWRTRRERKARIQTILHWLFPQRRYMLGLYPILERFPFLLWGCWLRRLLHMAFRPFRRRLEKAFHLLYFRMSPFLEKLLSFWERKGPVPERDEGEEFWMEASPEELPKERDFQEAETEGEEVQRPKGRKPKGRKPKGRKPKEEEAERPEA